MALIVDFDDLKPSAHKRLLKEAVLHQMVRQLPLHRRKDAAKNLRGEEEDEAGEKHEYGSQDEYDREQRADLNEKTHGAPAVHITVHDFSPDVVQNAMPDMPKKGGAKTKRKKV